MYTSHNYRTKKSLKADVRRRNELLDAHADNEADANYDEYARLTRRLEVYQPGIGKAPSEGVVYLEGPHYPQPHTWYARAKVKRGVIVHAS